MKFCFDLGVSCFFHFFIFFSEIHILKIENFTIFEAKNRKDTGPRFSFVSAKVVEELSRFHLPCSSSESKHCGERHPRLWFFKFWNFTFWKFHFFEKVDFWRKIHQKHFFQTKFSPRLFRLHILDSDHVWSTVFFETYSKIKNFVHEEPLHHPPQKSNNFRIFMIFFRSFESFTIFIGLDGADPGVRKFWFSSMLRRKQYFKCGLNLKCVIWKVLEKTCF